jgi:hypothetical protein
MGDGVETLNWLQQEGDENMVKLLLEVKIDMTSVISGSWNHPPLLMATEDATPAPQTSRKGIHALPSLRVLPSHLECLPRRPRGLGPSPKTNLERPSNGLWQGNL